MFNGLVSIIIPSYNREKTIQRAIISLINQTYKNLEIIVVDDSSSDNTRAVIHSIKDPRVKYHRLAHNSGACVARNIGVSLARGVIIAFQDSDDFWHPDKLEKQLHFLTENSFEFISCAYNRITENQSTPVGIVDCPKEKTEIWCKLLNNNWVSTQTIVCYKYCFDKISFDPSVKRYQDWDLALQAACYYKLGHLNERLVDVFLQENSITNTVKSEKAKQYIVDKHRTDVDFSSKKMVAQYYKTVADVNRKSASFKASKYYFKSFILEPSPKKIVCWLLSAIGLIKYYNPRL